MVRRSPRGRCDWRVAGAWAILVLGVSPAAAQAPDYRAKFTTSLYRAAGRDRLATDVNLRYSVGNWTGWVGQFVETNVVGQARAGIQYNLQHDWLLVVPSAQVATQGFFGGSLYSEIGTRYYVIAGLSRTNLQPYYNLSFDPNESWQLGAGMHVSERGAIAFWTIWDNRLDTGQQNSHLALRQRFRGNERIVLDLSYKSGHGDQGSYVRGIALAGEFDWQRWFVKLAGDQHANFRADTVWRLGGGVRF